MMSKNFSFCVAIQMYSLLRFTTNLNASVFFGCVFSASSESSSYPSRSKSSLASCFCCGFFCFCFCFGFFVCLFVCFGHKMSDEIGLDDIQTVEGRVEPYHRQLL